MEPIKIWTSYLEKSTAAIAPYIAEMFCEGYANQQSLENLFARIRQIGIEAEKAMFEATKGINTHKGILFTMGIISGAAGYYYRKQHHFCVEEVLTLGGAMCQKALQNDFEKIINKIQASRSLIDIPLTHGEKMYLRYGIRGARGAAQDGFPILADYLWPLFGKYKKERKKRPYPKSSNPFMGNYSFRRYQRIKTRRDRRRCLAKKSSTEHFRRRRSIHTKRNFRNKKTKYRMHSEKHQPRGRSRFARSNIVS